MSRDFRFFGFSSTSPLLRRLLRRLQAPREEVQQQLQLHRRQVERRRQEREPRPLGVLRRLRLRRQGQQARRPLDRALRPLAQWLLLQLRHQYQRERQPEVVEAEQLERPDRPPSHE